MYETLRDDGWGDPAAQALAGVIAAVDRDARVGQATLDFDDTCISGDLGDAVFHHAVEAGALDPRGLPGAVGSEGEPEPAAWLAAADHALAEGGPARAYAFVVQAFAGWTIAEFRRHVGRVLESELRSEPGSRPLAGGGGARVRSGIRRRRRVASLIEHLHRRGWVVRIVSGSAQWAVEEAVASLGVSGDRVRGVRVGQHDGRLTREVLEPLPFGPGKVEALRPELPGGPDLALGDSPNDRELLAWARTAVAFDAGDANSLGREARERGWAVEPATAAWRPELFG